MIPVPARILTGASILIAPLLVWLVLYVASRTLSVSQRPILWWLAAARYVTYAAGLVLWLAYPTLSRYGVACIAASAGISLPHTWVKRRFAPELIEETNADGWWPSKPE